MSSSPESVQPRTPPHQQPPPARSNQSGQPNRDDSSEEEKGSPGRNGQPKTTNGPGPEGRSETTARDPNLFLVRKHKLGNSPDDLYRLSAEREALLTEVVQEEGEVEPENVRFQELLKRIYEEEFWIGCTCREGRPFKEAPVPLTTVQQRKNQYVLLRLPKRASHREGCPFEGEGAKSDPARREGERIKERGVCFHREIPERTEERSRTEKTGNRQRLSAKRETPERCLYTVLESSRLNQSKGEEWTRGEAFGRIYEAADEIPLASRFTLQEYLWVRPWDLVEAAEYIRNDWEKWPNDSQAKPQGVFVFEAEEIEDQTLVYDRDADGEHEVDNLEIRSPEMDGPHLVLMTIAGSDDRPKYMEPRKAFAVPIVGSPRYFPVWSETERNVSAYLIDEFEEINQGLEEPLTLHKPLFSEPTRLGSCCPDLQIQWRDQVVVIRLVENLETYIGNKEGLEETLDFQRLGEMGRPHVIETEGDFSFRLIKRVTNSINESLDAIRKETGGTTQVEL